MKRLLLVALLLPLPACATAETPIEELDRLAATTPWQKKGERTVRELHLQGQIEVFQEQHTNGVSTLAIDQSGRGAVLCAQGIYVGLHAGLSLCHPEEREWIAELSEALDRIDTFVATNGQDSATPWRSLSAKEQARAETTLGNLTAICRQANPSLMEWLDGLKKNGHGRFHAEVDRMLAVPRLPVMAPCL